MDPLHRRGASPTDDTDPVIDAMLIEGYRRMSPAQKLERVRALMLRAFGWDVREAGY